MTRNIRGTTPIPMSTTENVRKTAPSPRNAAKNTRGITPIISMILLIMMTIGISGLAWIFLQSITGSIMGNTKNMTDRQMQQMLTNMDIVDYGLECNSTAVSNVSVLIFNRGSTSIALKTVLVEGSKVNDADLKVPATLQQGTMDEIKILNAQKYFKGLNLTTTRQGRVLISAGDGYVTTTLSISGSRCP